MKAFIRCSLAMLVLSFLLPPLYGDEKIVHVPTLSPVPPELESTYGERRRQLQRDLDTLRASSANLGSQKQRDALAAQVRDWAGKAKAFNTELAAAKRALSSTELASPQPSTTQQDIERLKQLREKLEAQLAKVQKWIADGKKDQAEFEQIRKNAEIDFVDDVLKHIPAGEAFDGLEKLGYLSHSAATSLKLGYDALTDSLSAAQAISGKDDAEKLSKILEARTTLRDAMMAGAVSKLDPNARKWLENIEKVFDSAAKTVATGLKGEKADKVTAGTVADRLSALGQTLVQTGTTIYPPAELIVGVDAVGEKVGQRIAIMPALDSLNEAAAGEFKAERYLRQKIAQVDAQIAAAQSTHR